jgi:hypothetical protein
VFQKGRISLKVRNALGIGKVLEIVVYLTSPLKAPNRLKSLKLAWRFVLTSCDIYQNPFTQEKILKFWQRRTKNVIFRLDVEQKIIQLYYVQLKKSIMRWIVDDFFLKTVYGRSIVWSF